jgi:predicted nucleic acid-binding protein
VIVVDSNVIAYCWINGPRTELAQRVRVRDADWHVPVLWRSELRNILVGYFRDQSLSASDGADIMAAAENGLAGREHLVPSASVFEVCSKSKLSAYEGEFVALAGALAAPLVTADSAVLKAFPRVALTMEGFLQRAPS